MSKLNIDQQTIKELFSNKKSDFLIPDYQRPYAWEESECQTLWDDIFVFAFPENDYTKFDSDNDEYFLGPIVTFKNDEGKLEIIDGQQRLTTLMLLLRAFYSKFGNMKDQYAVKTSEDISTCIWKTNEFGQPDKNRLKIDSEVSTDDDKEEFLSILKTGIVDGSQKSKYARTYRFFQEKINEFLQEYPAYFAYLPTRILNNCILLPIEAESQDTALRIFSTLNDTPADVNGLSKKQKKTFIKLFRDLDHDYAHLKSFSTFEPKILDEYGFSQQIYEDYAAVYNNVIEELKKDPPDDTGDEPIRDDYDLVAYSKFKIDFEYIVELLQGFVDFLDQKDIEFNEAEFEHKLLELKEIVKDFAEDNPKLSDLLLQVLDEIEQDKAKFMGQDMSVIINQMRYTAIDKEIEKFSKKWYVPFEAVKYEAYNYKDGELANENKLKELADYATYKMEISEALPKFKFNGTLIREFKEILMPEIGSLIE